jgi:ABC-type sugar transport system ATPase subunit
MSEKLKSQFDIRTPSIKQLVRKLSGGNQQKIVLAKWLLTDPDILLVNEPTHGVDVGAKAEIYKLFNDLTEKGKGILLISSELPELLLLSDRIAVLYNGELKGILPRSDATEEKIAAMASGL